jgi:hypothetical protein
VASTSGVFKDLFAVRGFLDQDLMFYSDEAQLSLNGNVNNQNNRY